MQTQKQKMLIGIGLGFIAGTIDIVPMFIQQLPIDAILSAFSMWLTIGFLLSIIKVNLGGTVKGVLISFIVLIPTAIIIGWTQPISLIPICIMTLIIGSTIGILTDKLIQG